jgi:hypothetical protein
METGVTAGTKRGAHARQWRLLQNYVTLRDAQKYDYRPVELTNSRMGLMLSRKTP